MVQLSAFALAAAFACVALQSTGAAPRDPTRVRRILMLGDSLTDGFRLQRSQAYPALIAGKLRAAGMNYEVINAGVSGDTTAGGLRRLPRYLDRPIDVLLLELGINDAFRALPVEQMRSNLQGIIDQAKKANPKLAIVVEGMQLPLYGADAYVREFGQMYVDLADKNGAALIPYLLEGVGGDPTLNLNDRIHPNAAGHKILAENVWRVLGPLLRKATALPAARVN